MPTHYVSRTYINLWTAVELHVQRESDTQDKDQRLAARLSALVLTFFTLEAYLNHLGMLIRPDLWEGNNERKYFSGRKEIDGQKFFGPIGKLQFLYSQCGLIYDKASDEIQTIQKLKEFRDLLAHGRTEEDFLPISSLPGQRPIVLCHRFGNIFKVTSGKTHTRMLERLSSSFMLPLLQPFRV